jgi:hypothetical protein
LPTRVGHAEWGDNRFRGYSVACDLAGRESMAGLLALAIAGRRVDDNERLILDDIATIISVADPRIWLLKLVRLASAYGGCNAGVAAITVSLENAPIGHHATGTAAELLLDMRRGLLAAGADGEDPDDRVLEEQCRRSLADHRQPFGFWVPFRARDERVEMLAERVAARGRATLPYWRLFAKIADIFWRIDNLRPSAPVAVSAVCLDMGFTPVQIGPLVTAMGASDFWANAFEGAAQMPPSLQTIPASWVRYLGPQPRMSPRALARQR